MPEIEETIFAPELTGGEWLQGGPVSLSALRGKGVALIDFWDYTCVNCIRTLPYVVEWHRHYARHGLTVVGVHAPEFTFARQSEFVLQAIKDFQIDYPVVLDNSYVIWRSYSNRFWPAKYLVDGRGRIRYYHYGEGSYRETEAILQALIAEINPAILCRCRWSPCATLIGPAPCAIGSRRNSTSAISADSLAIRTAWPRGKRLIIMMPECGWKGWSISTANGWLATNPRRRSLRIHRSRFVTRLRKSTW